MWVQKSIQSIHLYAFHYRDSNQRNLKRGSIFNSNIHAEHILKMLRMAISGEKRFQEYMKSNFNKHLQRAITLNCLNTFPVRLFCISTLKENTKPVKKNCFSS